MRRILETYQEEILIVICTAIVFLTVLTAFTSAGVC